MSEDTEMKAAEDFEASIAEPEQYTSAPVSQEQQDEVEKPEEPPLTFALMSARTSLTTPRWPSEALKYAQGQSTHPSRDWAGLCQMFVRSSYALPGGFSSAYLQWLGADPEDKHVGGDPTKAPVGVGLCYKGSGPDGHIMLSSHPFQSGTAAAWSNDLVKHGKINKVSRTAPTTAWGQKYLGYITSINHYDIKFPQSATKPKPQTKKYGSILRSIDYLEQSLSTAVAQKDVADQKILKAEIARLDNLYKTLRRA